MKKLIVSALGLSLLMSGANTLSVHAESSATSTESSAYEQSKSNTMRMEYYNKYKAKGYDMSVMSEKYLDASQTTESQFWEALKYLQNVNEIGDRRLYVEKLKNYGLDVSGFTEEVISDSGKFWDMVKSVEAGKKMVEAKKEEVKKTIETKKEEVKDKVETKKEEVKKNVEEKKAAVVLKVSAKQEARLKELMQNRIDKIATDKREATLTRLETIIMKRIELAKAKNATLLTARYEILLSVIQQELAEVDDESLIADLFTE